MGWALLLLVLVLALLPTLRERMRRPITEAQRQAAPGEVLELSRGATQCRWSGRVRGPVAVCVHGLTTPSEAWDGFTPYLEAAGFRVLVYDLYGRGLSDAPAGRQDLAFFTDQLREVLDHYGLTEDVTLFGYSMGGLIAAKLAGEEPQRFRQVALVAPAGLGMPFSPAQRFAMRWPWIGDWVFQVRYPRAHAAALRAGQTPEEVLAVQLAQLDRRGFVPGVLSSLRHTLADPAPQVFSRLAATGLPVLAVWGGADRVIPVACMGRLAQSVRRAHQEVLEEADHGLPFTHPEPLARAMARMMDELRLRPSRG
ncbi:alpha/beta hydrolase [Roseivivax sp. GX 12232]|uniref:alpha/beta fold hydrolase n=1 Tax=Roseivivax sp. GX 12232 TaxID=2900547 RepID=UPI001E405B42|nr:alpha/beta hydrolase [Roseivivax sp. GX 12232]MCE0506934.1 alpha/beta hydrolase [Roseivivax sp. GX 12232]